MPDATAAGRSRKVHDERAVRVDDSGDAARQHPRGLLGGAASAELLGDARHRPRHARAAVPSGVASRGPTPVPPVVTMSRTPASTNARQRPLDAVGAVGDDHGVVAREAGLAQRGDGDRSARVLALARGGAVGDRDDGGAVRHASSLEERQASRRSSRTTTDFDVGVPLTSATESSGTSTLVSG